MSRNISSIFVTALFIALISMDSHAQAAGPKATAAAFYKFDLANSQIFNLRNIDARKRWFSADLYKLFLKELARERAYIEKNPTDKPHFGDGLPFQATHEACEIDGKQYPWVISYGRETIKGETGSVDVYFKYPKGCNVPDILYAVNMEKQRGRWVIGDVRYIGGDTSLVEDLKRSEY